VTSQFLRIGTTWYIAFAVEGYPNTSKPSKLNVKRTQEATRKLPIFGAGENHKIGPEMST
jgi:hypothetical protein